MNRHETTDMDPRYVLYFAIALVIAGVAIHAGLWWMFHQFEQQQVQRETHPGLGEVSKPPEPRLQIDPQADLEDMQRRENQILGSYGWVDRNNGIARVPIERAMQLVLERQKK